MPRVLLKGGAAKLPNLHGNPDQPLPQRHDAPLPVVPRGPPRQCQQLPRHQRSNRAQLQLKGADHRYTAKVVVRAVRNGHVVGTRDSAAFQLDHVQHGSSRALGREPGRPCHHREAGHLVDRGWTKLWWRRTGNPIAGQNGLKYRVRPADAGKEISLLAIGEYEFPNGVHPIDRYAARSGWSGAPKPSCRGASPAPGRLGITAISYAAGAKQSIVRGRLAIYDGSRLVKRTYLKGGRKVIRFSGMRRGTHNIKMVFVSNPWFAGSRVTRTFTVR